MDAFRELSLTLQSTTVFNRRVKTHKDNEDFTNVPTQYGVIRL